MFFWVLKAGKRKKTTFQIIIHTDTAGLRRMGREHFRKMSQEILSLKSGMGQVWEWRRK